MHFVSLGASTLVICFFALRAVIHYSRAGDRLKECTRTCEYLIASLDENREPDLRYDTITVSKRMKDLQAALGSGRSEARKLLKFRRDMLDDGRVILDNLERAKTSTEILPLCGVLGTAVGFMLASYLGSGSAAVDRGLWLALISTILALTATILLKWAYEGRLVPQYAHLLNQTQALERCIREGGLGILDKLSVAEADQASAPGETEDS